jgi:hypothetical protein
MDETFVRRKMNDSTNDEEFLRQIRTLSNDVICKSQVTGLLIENKILIKMFRFGHEKTPVQIKWPIKLG